MNDRFNWTFHRLDFPQGYVYFTLDDGDLDVWTMNRDSGNFLYMWSCHCDSIDHAVDLIYSNYDSENIFWEIVEN